MNLIYLVLGLILIIINILLFFYTRKNIESKFRYIMIGVGLLLGILFIIGAFLVNI